MRSDIRRILQGLQKRAQLNLALESRGDSLLSLRGKRVRELKPGLPSEEIAGVIKNPSREILSGALTSKIRAVLRREGISYFDTETHELHLVEEGLALTLKEETPPRKKRTEDPDLWRTTGLKPLDIISPMGLPIADTILRLPFAACREFKSANQFAVEFGLYQPKLSRMMISAGARDLAALSKSLHSLNMDWWQIAFTTSSARRQLQPFFVGAQIFHMRENDLFQELRARWIESRIGNIPAIPGPRAVAANLGHLVEDAIDFWVPIDSMPQFKKRYRLIPGSKPEFPTVWLAESKKPFAKEGLLSPLFKYWDEDSERQLPLFDGTKSPIKFPKLSQNILRAAWDLHQGPSRHASAAYEIVRELKR